MFTSLRESAQGIFAKLILLFLVGVFVLWGIGDIFRTGGFGGNNIASVGHTSISIQEFARAYRHRVEELRQMLGKAYTPQLPAKLGIPQQVLAGLINNLLIEKEEDALGIVVSDEAVVNALHEDPQLQDANKQFNKAQFQNMLRAQGITEQYYVSQLRRNMAGGLLLATLARSAQVPDDLVNALYKARGEQRTAEFMVIAPDALPALPAPTAKEIQAYYDAHAGDFQAPQYRTLSYVVISMSDMQKQVKVSDEDIKHAYDEHAQDLRHPEQRVVEQMLFDKQSDAIKAAAALSQGKSFEEVARTANISNKGKLSLGALERDKVPAAADAVFALKEGGTTDPVQSPFGWHIFHVTKIIPEGVESLADARPDIERELAARAAQETIYTLVGQLEDALAGGATMEKAAQKVGQTVKTVGPVTSEGLSPDGKKAALPPYEGFLSTAFTLSEGDHSQATQAPDGSYFLVHADKVTAEHTRPLAEVKDQVVAAWKAEKREQQLKAVADSIEKDIHAGKSVIEAFAAAHVKTAAVSVTLKRTSEMVPEGNALSGKTLPRLMVLDLFRRKLHESTQAYAWPAGGMMIATLSQVIAAGKPADADLAAIRKELKDKVGDEVLSDYIQFLQDKYRVTVNNAALAAVSQESGE